MSSVDCAAWDALDHGRAPFLRSGFLRALEDSGSIGPDTGWNPVYFLVEEETPSGGGRGPRRGRTTIKKLIGGAAGFIKTDSYGEYIFDWAWASAARRAGLRYYPKLTFAAPVTPATGQRILSRPGAPAGERDLVIRGVVTGAIEVADAVECSSVHWLFCTDDEADALVDIGFARRATHQYHWHNQGYETFDDFLATMTSRRRKQIRRERRRAIEGAGPVEWIAGGELDKKQLDRMDRLYRENVHAHGGFDYLRRGFFHRLAELAPEHLLFAHAGPGGAIFLESDEALYGRYWGCSRFVEFLHFEVAYYAGIERCIERGTPLFEAGAQGGHKLLRGFEPSLTNSCHFFRDPRFDAAIRNFLDQEAAEVAHEMLRLAEMGPYKKE